jgi:hypothetical protein
MVARLGNGEGDNHFRHFRRGGARRSLRRGDLALFDSAPLFIDQRRDDLPAIELDRYDQRRRLLSRLGFRR